MSKGRLKNGALRDWDGIERAVWIAGLINGEWANLSEYAFEQKLRYQTVRRMAAKYGWHAEATRVRQMAEQRALVKIEDQEVARIVKAKKQHLETAILMRNVMLDGLMPKDPDTGVRKLREGLTATEGIRAGRAAIKIERDAYGMGAQDVEGAGLAVGPEDGLVQEIIDMGDDARKDRIAYLQRVLDGSDGKTKT